MSKDNIEEDMRKRHDPDLSNEAWDKRWEKAEFKTFIKLFFRKDLGNF